MPSYRPALVLVVLAGCGFAQPADVVLVNLVAQATLSTASMPKQAAPGALIALAEAIAPCDIDAAGRHAVQAFESALALRPFDQNAAQTCLRCLRWLSSASMTYRRLELLTKALDLASEFDFEKSGVSRQQAYEPMLRALVQLRSTGEVSALITRIETHDARFPFQLFVVAMPALTRLEILDQLLFRGYTAIAQGKMTVAKDLQFVEQTIPLVPKPIVVESLDKFLKSVPPTADPCLVEKVARLLDTLAPSRHGVHSTHSCPDTVPPPPPDEDPVSQSYKEILAAAESGSALLAQVLTKVTDPDLRKALMLSAMRQFQKQGNVVAFDRLAAAFNSLMPGDSLQKNPAELISLARSTPPGDARDALVRRALSLAENIIREDNAIYQESENDEEKLRVYLRSSQESIAAYQLAARDYPQLAAESALQISGPQRADALVAVITARCAAN